MKINLLDSLPRSVPQELVTTLLCSEAVRIERIVSYGQVSPPGFWYDQPEGEWVLLLAGSATLRVGERCVALLPGDALNLPAGTRHRVEATALDGPTVWLAVFYRAPVESDAEA
jgi:cupin 2 domain-containing protein